MNLKIKRIEENGKRKYLYEKNGIKLTGTSVTTFIDLFQDNSWKEKYWYPSLEKQIENADFYSEDDIKTICLEKANEISKQSSDYGTEQHALIEKYRLGKVELDEIPHPDLRHFLNSSKSITSPHFSNSSELPIFYRDDSFNFNIGGTLDDLLNVNCNNLYDKQTEFEIANKRKDFIIDWKFLQYPKYSDKLLKYMLQLAVYRLGLNFTYNLQLNDALIVMTPKFTNNKKNKLCNITYFYYLDKRKLNYFQEKFFDMIDAYSLGDCSLFNWLDFAKEAKELNYLAERVYLKC